MESDPRSRSSGRTLVATRRTVTIAASAAVAALLAWSAIRDVPHSWRLLRSQHAAYAGYTRAERDRAFGVLIPIPMDIIDFWRVWLRPGDRYWIQIPDEAFSAFGDKRLVVRSVSHIYLLPAIETRHLSQANVVLSWDSDPGLLHLRYSEVERAGQQLIFFARIARDR